MTVDKNSTTAIEENNYNNNSVQYKNNIFIIVDGKARNNASVLRNTLN